MRYLQEARAMRLPFTKMHGLGNDFVVVQANGTPPPDVEKIRALADRHTGIGFDQLLWVDKARIAGAVAFYRIFNTDGSEAEQCGNGARCIAALLGAGPGRGLVLQHRGGTSRARIELNNLVSGGNRRPAIRSRQNSVRRASRSNRAIRSG